MNIVFQINYYNKQKLVLALSQQINNNQNQIQENLRVIKPNSIGLYAMDPSKEVKIVRVFYRPSGVAYEAQIKLNIDASDELSWGRVTILNIKDVLEIVGETKMGIFNYNTGMVD